MEFNVTPEFVDGYELLTGEAVELVDDAIRRVLADPGSAWARQNRVVGDDGWAWIVVVKGKDADLAVYWRQGPDETPLFLLLIASAS